MYSSYARMIPLFWWSRNLETIVHGEILFVDRSAFYGCIRESGYFWMIYLGDIFSQLVGNKMAHNGRKYRSSQCGSTKTSKLSCARCYKGRGCCYGLCTVAFFLKWSLRADIDGLRHWYWQRQWDFLLTLKRESLHKCKLTKGEENAWTWSMEDEIKPPGIFAGFLCWKNSQKNSVIPFAQFSWFK